MMARHVPRIGVIVRYRTVIDEAQRTASKRVWISLSWIRAFHTSSRAHAGWTPRQRI